MSIIQNKDIYDSSQGNPLEIIEKYLDILDGKVQKLTQSMKSLEGSIMQTNKSGSGTEAQTLVTNTEKLRVETEKLTAVQKEEAKIQKQLETAKAKLASLDSEQAIAVAELNKQIREKNKQNQLEATINSKLSSDYDKQSAQLNKLINDYKKLSKEQQTNTQEGKDLLKNIQDLDKELKDYDATIGRHHRKVGDYLGAVKGLKVELRGLKGVLLNSKEGTDEFNNALKRSAEIYDDLSDMQERIKGTAMDFGGVMGNVTKIVSGAASAFEAVQGAQALFGEQSEEVQKAMLKIQAAIALANGLQGLEGFGKALQNFGFQLKSTAIGTKLVTAAQWLWNTAMAANPIGLIIAGLVALGSAIYAVTKYLDSNEKALLKERTALDGTVHASKEAAEAHNEHVAALRELDRQLAVLIGTMTEYQAQVASLGDQYFKTLGDIDKETKEKLENTNGFWSTLWRGIKSGGSALGALSQQITDNAIVYTEAEEKKTNASELLDKELELLAAKELERQKDKNKKDYEDYKKLQEAKTKELERAANERFQLERDIEAAGGVQYSQMIDGKIAADVEYNDFEAQQLAEINALRKDDLDKHLSYFDQVIEKRIEEAELTKQLEEEKRAVIFQTMEFAGASFAKLLEDGQLTYREFGKFVLKTMLDVAERMLFIGVFEIWLKQLASKGLAGAATAGIITGIVKGLFQVAKNSVMSFATGTDYVQGPGSETSDSIPAMLSKGERVIPANINKQLLGVKNKDLPMILNNGMNSLRLEMLMSEVRENTSKTAFYLQHGKSQWYEDKWQLTNDWNTGTIHKRKLDD